MLEGMKRPERDFLCRRITAFSAIHHLRFSLNPSVRIQRYYCGPSTASRPLGVDQPGSESTFLSIAQLQPPLYFAYLSLSLGCVK